jgi:hypothetical protein
MLHKLTKYIGSCVKRRVHVRAAGAVTRCNGNVLNASHEAMYSVSRHSVVYFDVLINCIKRVA